MNEQHTHDGKAPFDWNDIYSGEVTDCAAPDPLILKTVATLPTRGRALDVGCGAGGLVLALARSGWEVSGVDIASRAIEGAKKTMAKHGVRAALSVADASTWTPEGTYDLITNCFALPNTQRQQVSALYMMTAALAPGGTLILKDFDATMRRLPQFGGFHLPSVEELTAALDGLELIQAEVVETPAHHHADHSAPAGSPWTAAMIVARKPTT